MMMMMMLLLRWFKSLLFLQPRRSRSSLTDTVAMATCDAQLAAATRKSLNVCVRAIEGLWAFYLPRRTEALSDTAIRPSVYPVAQLP